MSLTYGNKFPVLNLRSDTMSHPTPAMRRAMMEAVVGDDVFGEDPTANTLEARVASLFNKEAAIFLPTGTMGNVIASLAHSDRRGAEILLGDKSHIFLYEQGAPSQFGGIHVRTIPNLPDGTFDLEILESLIRPDNVLSPITTMIAVENTHNMCGGKVLPEEWLFKLSEIAKKHGVAVHMDGARIFNASVYLGRPVAELTKHMDSVQFCFSKGLGCPLGSMLIGTKQFIHKARRLRKAMGAGMRQVGVIAAPCLVALDTMIDRLADDHRNARTIAQEISTCNHPCFKVDLEGLHTNILMIHLLPNIMTSAEFCSRLSEVSEEEEKILGEDAVIVQVSPNSKSTVRLVTYWQITEDHVEKFIKKFQFVASRTPTQ